MKKPAIYAGVQTTPLDIAAEIACLTGGGAIGATALFIGSVRGGEVQQLSLEHYPGMTEIALLNIATNAAKRWELLAVRIVHRSGALLPAEAIVFVGVASAHRAEAFRACEYITDYLKSEAPFWKKEHRKDGDRWVESHSKDIAARQRWESHE